MLKHITQILMTASAASGLDSLDQTNLSWWEPAEFSLALQCVLTRNLLNIIWTAASVCFMNRNCWEYFLTRSCLMIPNQQLRGECFIDRRPLGSLIHLPWQLPVSSFSLGSYQQLIDIPWFFLTSWFFKGSVSRDFLGPFLACMDRSRSV